MTSLFESRPGTVADGVGDQCRPFSTLPRVDGPVSSSDLWCAQGSSQLLTSLLLRANIRPSIETGIATFDGSLTVVWKESQCDERGEIIFVRLKGFPILLQIDIAIHKKNPSHVSR